MTVQADGAGTLKAGAASVDITPPLGLVMGGYRKTRHASGVHDPLCARALVLQEGKTQLALLALDLIALPRDCIARACRLVEERCRIPPEAVTCWSTHTHTGPVTDHRMPPGVLAQSCNVRYLPS